MGSGRSSRLYKALVDETQIASTVWAFADTREHTSLLTLHATAASPDITTDTLAEHIFNQVEKLQKDGLLAHEMEKTRNSVATSHAAALQTSSGVADALTNYVLLWDNPHEINSSVDKYFSVSNQDVMDFSHNYMNPSQAIRTDVVPMEE
jgi:predicted Zn-dependent peptidase